MPNKRSVHDVVDFKADTAGKGTFTALAAVYGNVDLQGDRIVPGAFDATIAEWKAAGDPVPVIWSHHWDDPHAHIGAVDPANIRSTDRGLEVTGRLDVDDPYAAKVHRLMKDRRVKQMSFAYDIRKERTAEDGANELVDLELIEVGPVLKGANPMTGVMAVKNQQPANGNGKQSDSKPEPEPEAKAEPEAANIMAKVDQILSRLDTIEARLPAKADDTDPSPDDEDLSLQARIAELSQNLEA